MPNDKVMRFKVDLSYSVDGKAKSWTASWSDAQKPLAGGCVSGSGPTAKQAFDNCMRELGFYLGIKVGAENAEPKQV